ncbi:NAD(P)-binding protein [Piedraia hortae CBS 480.64]|uniref:NAD(P)-binding protein n=1 Tax=Piedraia hortae CBS 480.64 TaxID=1314780 RepID=A0A6A7C3C7_9PEZI|nr:NAD(P)-binding protein [Piedraia hortae CBS 480.64]
MSSSAASRLNGKTILITGASSGIGRAAAHEFAQTAPEHNLKLILTARRTSNLDEVSNSIKSSFPQVSVHTAQLDMTSSSAITSFLPSLPKEYQEIDILVNNAGTVRGVAPAGEVPEDHISSMIDTNVSGLIHMTQAVLPGMKSRNRGDIINIGSIAGREGYPGGSIYCASKAAVRAFTEAMRKELISTKVRVMEIDPGQVETEFSIVRFSGDEKKAKEVYKGVDPLTPEDIAETIVWVASRRENVVVADMLVFPNHQAAAQVLHRRQ